MHSADSVYARIYAEIQPFPGYRAALARLEAVAPGYALAFAFHYANADISNGGISQLYANPTWSLVLRAHEAASLAGCDRLAALMREILYYYERKGRSRFRRQLPPDFFAGMPGDWDRTLVDLEDECWALEDDRQGVVERLVERHPGLFDAPAARTAGPAMRSSPARRSVRTFADGTRGAPGAHSTRRPGAQPGDTRS